MGDGAGPAVPGLHEGVDAAPDADGEQRRPAVGVEPDEGGPQVPRLPGQQPLPVRVLLRQGAGGRGVVQPRREAGEAGAARVDLQAGLGRAGVEGPQRQRVQQRQQRRVRVGRQRRPQRQGAVRRQLRHQPLGQAPAVVRSSSSGSGVPCSTSSPSGRAAAGVADPEATARPRLRIDRAGPVLRAPARAARRPGARSRARPSARRRGRC